MELRGNCDEHIFLLLDISYTWTIHCDNNLQCTWSWKWSFAASQLTAAAVLLWITSHNWGKAVGLFCLSFLISSMTGGGANVVAETQKRKYVSCSREAGWQIMCGSQTLNEGAWTQGLNKPGVAGGRGDSTFGSTHMLSGSCTLAWASSSEVMDATLGGTSTPAEEGEGPGWAASWRHTERCAHTDWVVHSLNKI